MGGQLINGEGERRMRGRKKGGGHQTSHRGIAIKLIAVALKKRI